HFNDPVVHVPLDPGGGPEHQAPAGMDIALDLPAEHDVRHLHGALDGAALTHRQRRLARLARAHRADTAGDVALEVQPALELEISLHMCALADQRIDAR